MGIKPFIIFRFIIDLGDDGDGGVARLYIHLQWTDGPRTRGGREPTLVSCILAKTAKYFMQNQ